MLLVLVVNLVFIFIGLFFLPYFIWEHYASQKRRSVEMAFMAKKLGLRFDQARDPRMNRRHGFLRKIKGWRRYALNVMSGKFEDHPVTIFEYHSQKICKDCKSWEYSRWIEHKYVSYFVVDLGKFFSDLTIIKEAPTSRLLSRVADAIGRGDIDFESHEFSELFDVRGEDKKFAYDFCNVQMMEYLLERPIIPIEVERSSLAIRFDANLNQGIIKTNVQHLLNIRKRMPDYLFAD